MEKVSSPFRKGRSIHNYEKHKAGRRSAIQKLGVDKKTDGIFALPLRVIGTGRCGTTWLAKTLQLAGFDVPHECCGQDGTVSMYFQADHSWYPYIPWNTGLEKGRVAHVGERLSDFMFKHTVHLVRHPLEVATSMKWIFNEIVFEWLHEAGICRVSYDERPILRRHLLAWIDMVVNCELQAKQTIDINNFVEQDWFTMLEKAGLERRARPILSPKNKSSGYKKFDPITWKKARNLLTAEEFTELKNLTEELQLCRAKTW